MADMDKSLDEIIEGKSFENGGRRGGNYRRDGPRRGGGIHKRRGGGRGGGPGGRGPRTVMITNLYYDLNEEDLEGLFSQIGSIERVKIQYDRSGRSEGYAWVTYRYPEDAFEAIRKFDGKKAAGQTISLTIAPGFFHEKRHNNLGDRLGRNDRKRGGGRPPRGGNGSGRRVQKSTEELDAELEAYMTGETLDSQENATNKNTLDQGTEKQSTEDSSNPLQPQNDNNEMAIDD